MFAPTKTWRKWHVKTNQNQKRFATASALAASALPSLVLARGHRIEQVPEIPLVIPDTTENFLKTKEAVALLQSINAYADVIKVSNSRKIRAGIGKIRNRRHRQRRGPLIVYNEDHGIVKSFRNLPGVELACVHHLNLLQLAPGGHLGRFVIWTQAAFAALDKIYGTYGNCSSVKRDYSLPQYILSNPDITRLINSDEVQSVVRIAGPKRQPRPFTQKKNPLKNNGIMVRLNPYAVVMRRAAIKASQPKTKGSKVEKGGSKVEKTKKKKPKASAGKRFFEIFETA
jgi:large subunit ribosomal protein L4e